MNNGEFQVKAMELIAVVDELGDNDVSYHRNGFGMFDGERILNISREYTNDYTNYIG